MTEHLASASFPASRTSARLPREKCSLLRLLERPESMLPRRVSSRAKIYRCTDPPLRPARQRTSHNVFSAATMLGAEVTEPEEHTYTEIVGRNPRARGRRTNRYRRIVAAYCLHDSDYQC